METVAKNKATIENGTASLGIELGSTRIKAVLIDKDGVVLENGGYDWENHLIDGIWTYSKEEIWQGVQGCYKDLADRVQARYGVVIKSLASIGFSGMMHGYLPFNKEGTLLVPFRTWRNNITGQAADELTELFQFNIPQRWSIAHLYQAILNGEEHVKDIAYVTTLAGYIHWKLTGKKVLGIGEASGMFPIDPVKKAYNQRMMDEFNCLLDEKELLWSLDEILPEVLLAGQEAGTLTEEGAKLLDVTGNLTAGIPFCPPEGDAGTGMVATNSVAVKTGNVSAGTSAFAMVVLEKELERLHRELDMVTTPTGELVAMSHANNCTSDINAWMNIFNQCLQAFGVSVDTGTLYKTLFEKSVEGDMDCGNLLSYCFYSGEHGVGLAEGSPLFVHPANSAFSLANFMKTQLYTCFGAMKLGMDILTKQEKVNVEKILGHGGIFKTKGVAQNVLAAALDVPVVVMETAGEGGPWGMALLASYMANNEENQSLEDYLNTKIFADAKTSMVTPDPKMVEGYEKFIAKYKNGLVMEHAAVEYMHQ